jgi:hypothetical protein
MIFVLIQRIVFTFYLDQEHHGFTWVLLPKAHKESKYKNEFMNYLKEFKNFFEFFLCVNLWTKNLFEYIIIFHNYMSFIIIFTTKNTF